MATNSTYRLKCILYGVYRARENERERARYVEDILHATMTSVTYMQIISRVARGEAKAYNMQIYFNSNSNTHEIYHYFPMLAVAFFSSFSLCSIYLFFFTRCLILTSVFQSLYFILVRSQLLLLCLLHSTNHPLHAAH